MGLGQYDSLGKYCDPHTASSVFLILASTSTAILFAVAMGGRGGGENVVFNVIVTQVINPKPNSYTAHALQFQSLYYSEINSLFEIN